MLSERAVRRIELYLNLPCGTTRGIRCPYYNNARSKRRGELRVLAGKGTPEEIIAEAKLLDRQYKGNLFHQDEEQCLCQKKPDASPETVRRFLIDHRLGIECSGFVTHVLRAHFVETRRIDIVKKFFIVPKRRFIRYLITRLRPVENIDVTVYANDRNTQVVASDATGWNYAEVKPGDVITILRTGARRTLNHIILVTDVKADQIHYVHARAWPSEGLYGHGVAEGTITITQPGKHLKEQSWSECGVSGEANETWHEIRDAEIVEIRRVNF